MFKFSKDLFDPAVSPRYKLINTGTGLIWVGSDQSMFKDDTLYWKGVQNYYKVVINATSSSLMIGRGLTHFENA